MAEKMILLTIVLMSAVTMIPRVLPMVTVGKGELPPFLKLWLSYVPAAVLAAMVVPELLIQHGHIDVSLKNVFFWSVFPTAFVAWKTRNLCLTVVIGMAIVAAARAMG